MKGERTIITVRKDRETGFWSYRVEQIIDGIYAGIVNWGSVSSSKYGDLKKAATHWLPSLREMVKDGNEWFYGTDVQGRLWA